MRRSLFVRIWKAVERHDEYFVLSVRNVVPTLTSTSAEIYLSLVGS
jgi:hypothetical protein